MLILFSIPVSLMFGITDIIFDRRKLLAIITTTITGGAILVWLYAIVLNVM